jgi:hypothetical protein
VERISTTQQDVPMASPRGSKDARLMIGGRRRRPEAWFDVALHGGLAGVFIVNALIAWLQPGDFVDLVEHSILARWFPVEPGRWVAWAICVNDLVLGILALVTIRHRQPRAAVLAWSGVWLLAVTVIKVSALDVVTT